MAALAQAAELDAVAPLDTLQGDLVVASYNLLAPCFVRPVDARTGKIITGDRLTAPMYPSLSRSSLARGIDTVLAHPSPLSRAPRVGAAPASSAIRRSSRNTPDLGVPRPPSPPPPARGAGETSNPTVRVRGVVESHAWALSIDPRPVVPSRSSVMIAGRSSRRARRTVGFLVPFIFPRGGSMMMKKSTTTTDADDSRTPPTTVSTTSRDRSRRRVSEERTRRDVRDDRARARASIGFIFDRPSDF